MTKKRLLIDVDEVLADFAGPFIQTAYEITGIRYTEDDFDGWDLFEALPSDEVRKTVFKAMQAPGYCSNFPVKPGALEAVRELRKIVEVTPTTRPFPSPTWKHDRDVWLWDHFGFEGDEIVNCTKKFLVHGDAFLDDSPENVILWQAAHPDGVAMLQHSFATKKQTEYDYLRVITWDEVIRKVSGL